MCGMLKKRKQAKIVLGLVLLMGSDISYGFHKPKLDDNALLLCCTVTPVTI